MAVQKITDMTAITGSNTATDDLFLVIDASTNEAKKITRAELNNAIEQDVLASIDVSTANIDGGTIDGVTIGGSSAGAGTFTTLNANGGVTIDNITIDGTEIDLSSGDLTVDVAGDIILDADGGDVFLKDGGTTFGEFTNSSTDFVVKSTTSDKDIIFKGNDGGSEITALTLDMSESGNASFNANVTTGAELTVGSLLKMPDNTSGKILVADGTSFQEVALSGDATIASNGAITVGTNAITTVKISADAVDGTKIADNAINSEHYTDGSIDTAHIADANITTAKLADSSVTTAKINADAIDGTKIADDSINSEHFVDGSIDTAHIADANITTAKLADNAVTTAKITDANVTTAKINDSAVTNDKLAGSIADSKLNTISTAGKVDIGALEIDGATDIGADLVDADLIIVDDGANGTERKSTLTRVKKYINSAISGDATVSDSGALTISSTAVDNSMLAGSIADSKLNTITTADKVAGGAIQIDSGTDGTSITIADTDKFLIDDAGTTKYVNASQISTYISTGQVTASSTTTFTNKTIDANGTGNSISNLEVADFASGVVDTDISSTSSNNDTLPSAKAVKTYVDSQTSSSVSAGFAIAMAVAL